MGLLLLLINLPQSVMALALITDLICNRVELTRGKYENHCYDLLWPATHFDPRLLTCDLLCRCPFWEWFWYSNLKHRKSLQKTRQHIKIEQKTVTRIVKSNQIKFCKHYLKYARIRVFTDPIFPVYDFALIRENTGDWKFLFSHILRSGILKF